MSLLVQNQGPSQRKLVGIRVSPKERKSSSCTGWEYFPKDIGDVRRCFSKETKPSTFRKISKQNRVGIWETINGIFLVYLYPYSSLSIGHSWRPNSGPLAQTGIMTFTFCIHPYSLSKSWYTALLPGHRTTRFSIGCTKSIKLKTQSPACVSRQ